VAFDIFLGYISLTFTTILQSVGETRKPALVNCIVVGLNILRGYILTFILNAGSWGIWFAMALSNVIGGVASLLWIRYGDWNKPIIKGDFKGGE